MPEQISIVVTAPPSYIPSQKVIDGHECARGDSGFVLSLGGIARQETASLGFNPTEKDACSVRFQEVTEPGVIITIDVTIHDDSLGGDSLAEAVKKYVKCMQTRLATYHGHKPHAGINVSFTRGKEMRSEWVQSVPG